MWTKKCLSSYSTIHLAHPFKMTLNDGMPLRCCFAEVSIPGDVVLYVGKYDPLWRVVSSAKYFEANWVGWFNEFVRAGCSVFGFCWSATAAGSPGGWLLQNAVGSPSWVSFLQVCRLQDFVKERQRWKLRVDEKEMLFKVADKLQWVGKWPVMFSDS